MADPIALALEWIEIATSIHTVGSPGDGPRRSPRKSRYVSAHGIVHWGGREGGGDIGAQLICITVWWWKRV